MNCFILPDGKPFYGGTYFTPQQWVHVLSTLAEMIRREPQKIREYADELAQGIKKAETFITQVKEGPVMGRDHLKQSVDRWKKRFDPVNGGPNKAPKFPMPSNYLFLLRYAVLSGDEKLLSHVNLTLTRMAYGGINDHVHGGFARYSTDAIWKVPHFEKMLYDNAQLASLYTEAFTLTKNPLYGQTARSIISFVLREWRTPEGGFYSAYDADSEGEEGKYYVWEKEELETILGEDFPLFAQYYEINETGYWENGNYILMRNPNIARLTGDTGKSIEQLDEFAERCRSKLAASASKREKPGLDDKRVTAWNALMCTALAKASVAFDEPTWREASLRCMQFITDELKDPDGHLLRTYKNGQARVRGFLDDYVFVAEAMMTCYQVTAREQFLFEARNLIGETFRLFQNPDSPYFYYTSAEGEQLMTRNTETSDNVIPSSNAQMAINLFAAGIYFDRNDWKERSQAMLAGLSEEILHYAGGYSHWACLALHMAYPFREVVVVGKDVEEKAAELCRAGITNAILAVSEGPSDLPLLASRYEEGKTLIYVCENKACRLPVENVSEALLQFE